MYIIKVFLKQDDDKNNLRIEKNYENDYQLKRELTNIGVNGLIYENTYYPPNRISKIIFKSIK